GAVAGYRQPDMKLDRRLPGVALGHARAVDVGCRGVVVEDGQHRVTVLYGRVGRVAQIDQDGLVQLVEGLADDRQFETGDGLPRGKGEVALGVDVVAGGAGRGRRAVGGRVVDGPRLAAGGGQVDVDVDGGEAVVALHGGQVRDRESGRSIVVENGALALA